MIYCYIDMFLYRQHHISTASAYLSSITLVLCFWKKKSAERKKSAKEKKKYVDKNSAPLPMIHRSLTFQGWLNSTELNIETKCSTFQQNVTCFKKMWNFHSYLTQSHFHTNMSQILLIMQTNHRKKYSIKRKHFSARRNCDNFTQICFQDKLLKSIFNLSSWGWYLAGWSAFVVSGSLMIKHVPC